MIDIGTAIGLLIGAAFGIMMFYYMGIFEEIYYLLADFP